ncbi:MAG: T9SS type A sorting domain-containing protein [Bacteroidales bacterium]|nr:T9SS type A sorting domain-containing protein [Bacteroidales bacterium]
MRNKIVMRLWPLLLTGFLALASPVRTFSQVNGVILSDTGNLTVVKLWGTHEERGYAYGYLLAEEIVALYDGYIRPMFGSMLTMAKQVIKEGEHIRIDSVFWIEAKAVVNGMADAGIDTSGVNYLDLLVANSMLDFRGLWWKGEGRESPMGCSSLMSWGDATTGTPLGGKSVISRHLDWTASAILIANQVLVIHVPAEAGERPWLMTGFSGQISVLSGLNDAGLSAFQHMMSDFSGTGHLNQAYEPIWFTLRKALESDDFNQDGHVNTLDIRDAIQMNPQGYADGYIVAAMAPSTVMTDSLTALVAEVAPDAPLLTFRSNEYPDSIPGDNLYAANFEIKRNNHVHLCPRYIAVMNALEEGLNIGAEVNWAIMRDHSNSGSGNIQFMQHVPEWDMFRISVHNNGKPAYQNTPMEFNTAELFSPATGTKGPEGLMKDVVLYPNPVWDVLNLSVPGAGGSYSWEILDVYGSLLANRNGITGTTERFSLEDMPAGLLVIRINAEGVTACRKLLHLGE